MARWLKVDVDIMSKQAIRAVARDCGCDVANAVLAWFRLYSWLDEQTADGTLYATHAELDAVAQLPGIAASFERSGWLSFDGDTCTVTNWDEHNGQNAKRRAEKARMMTRLREERRAAGIEVRPCPQMPRTKIRAIGDVTIFGNKLVTR